MNPTMTERNLSMADDRAAGMTYKDLEKKYNLDKSTIHHHLSKDECKAVIEHGSNQLVQFIPKAINNIASLLDSNTDSIKLRVSEAVLKTIGIMPSHTQTTYIQNIYNQTNNTVISQDVIELLKSRDQAIDIGYEAQDTEDAK